MNKFLKLIKEELSKRSLSIQPMFLENKVYIDVKGGSWLVESVQEDEIVATNVATSETQTFTPVEFAKQIDDTVQPQQPENKLQKVAQELRQEGLARIQQGQELCDKCCGDKECDDYRKGQDLQAQGYQLLKQAEEIKVAGDESQPLTVAQQEQQFLQNKEVIEKGQKLVEQGQIIINSIQQNPEEIIKVKELLGQAQQLIQQGCKEIVQGQQCQDKVQLVSQQEQIRELEAEVIEQCQFLQQQVQELQTWLDEQGEQEAVEQCQKIVHSLLRI